MLKRGEAEVSRKDSSGWYAKCNDDYILYVMLCILLEEGELTKKGTRKKKWSAKEVKGRSEREGLQVACPHDLWVHWFIYGKYDGR